MTRTNKITINIISCSEDIEFVKLTQSNWQRYQCKEMDKMEFIDNYLIPSFVPLLLTVVMLLLVAIFYNVRCTRLMKVQENIQQKKKEPEEHDERFATGGYC